MLSNDILCEIINSFLTTIGTRKDLLLSGGGGGIWDAKLRRTDVDLNFPNVSGEDDEVLRLIAHRAVPCFSTEEG